MNILIVTPYYEPNIVGGAEISTQLLAENMAKIGHKTHVLTIGKIDKEEIINNVIVHYINVKNMYTVWEHVLRGKKQNVFLKAKSLILTNYVNPKLVRRYNKFINRQKIDIAIINSNEECFGRASLWKSFSVSKIPAVLTLRDPLLLEKKIGRIDVSKFYCNLISKQMKWISAYAAPSKYMFNLYEKKGFYFDVKKVIYNAVDIEQTYKPTKRKRVLYAGGLVEKKGIRTLLNAVESLNNDDFELVFIGRGEMEKELCENSAVKVISWMQREALYKYMQESWVVVLPSEWPEAFGRVIIEAIFNGTLAIGSSAGGIPEIFDNDEKYIFQEKNTDELRKILDRIMKLTEKEYKNEVLSLQKKFHAFDNVSFCREWNSYIHDICKTKNYKRI